MRRLIKWLHDCRYPCRPSGEEWRDGLIRKSLILGTGGLVAPNSKKQRLQMQQLAALQSATPEEIRQRGGRNDVADCWAGSRVRPEQAVVPADAEWVRSGRRRVG